MTGTADAGAARCTLSIVVPVFNEEEALPALHRRLQRTMRAVGASWEIVYVDDGSADGTAAALAALQAQEPAVAVARLSRNFGKEAAMAAGLRLAQGEAVVLIDADLQDPPELIPQMLQAWRDGADVVNMRRRRRDGETWLKRATAYAFYRLFNRLSEVPVPCDVGDFRLLSRRAVQALNRLPEHNRFMKGLFAWVGFRQATIDYDRQPRAAGTTKWRYRRLWQFALEGITGFSVVPLKLATWAGLLIALAAFAYALVFVFKTFAFGEPVAGFPTLIVTILLLGGLQLMSIGILGEYVGRLFIETKQRPLFLLDYHRPSRPAAAGEPEAGS
ncbi:MAG: glycosyltransferase family 2 protein [Burkholderiaceae bacterium]|jgi:glycosyltransferase involved in cell wall biosynthesis|nr:glycosyltransferase family 2 protein [Burkholderiales bacterium]MCZ8339169.1 glycosyltransferase family 2 protein [Burkholderiaceae bacterium]